MYIPSHFRQRDHEAAIAFMQQHSFAIIISNDPDGMPVATHLPFHIAKDGDGLILTAHFAKANPQWKTMKEVLVMFSGPHAYVSPASYEREETVPTWNYIAVHAYGEAALVENEAEGHAILEDMIRQSEPAYLTQWRSLSTDYKARMYKGIVPFCIKVTRLDAKHKLSQNKTANERSNIITALQQSPDGTERELAAYMQEHKS